MAGDMEAHSTKPHPALGRGDNCAVEYKVADLTEYHDCVLTLWNAATNLPPLKKPRSKGMRSRDERGRTSRGGKISRRRLRKEIGEAVGRVISAISDDESRKAEFLRDLAVMIFQVRDCRTSGVGKGARDAAWLLFRHFATFCPQSASSLLVLFPEFGYWKDLNELHRSMRGESVCHMAIREKIAELFAEQLSRDIAALEGATESFTPQLSLCGKWAPRRNKMFDRDSHIAECIARKLYEKMFPGRVMPPLPVIGHSRRLESNKDNTDDNKIDLGFRSHHCSYEEIHYYSSIIARLNRVLKTTEVLMCEQRWASIHFNRVPGKCLHRNKKAFDKGDVNQDRDACKRNFSQFLESAKKKPQMSTGGRSVGVVTLVEEALKLMATAPGERQAEKDLLELQWRDIESGLQEQFNAEGWTLGRGIVLSDVSGSMGGTPLCLSIGMAVLVSRLTSEPWRNKFITFAHKPEFYDLSECQSFIDRVKRVNDSPWGGTTDFLAAFQLILDLAAKCRLQPEELPEWFMTISDMQFNEAASVIALPSLPEELREPVRTVDPLEDDGVEDDGVEDDSVEDEWKTHHQILTRRFHDAGLSICGRPYQLPHMIYWNARAMSRGLPVIAKQKGASMVSGFSENLIKLFIRGPTTAELDAYTPWGTMRAALDHARYRRVEKVLAEIKESPYFNNFNVQATDDEATLPPKRTKN